MMEKNNNQFSELRNFINSFLEIEDFVVIDIVNQGDNYAWEFKHGLQRTTNSILSDSTQTFYQDVYNWISTEYANIVSYSYMHDFTGGHTYHFNIENVLLRLMGESRENRTWIRNQVQIDEARREEKGKVK